MHFCFTILLRRSTYGASVNETNRMSYWEVSATIGKVAVDGREFDVYFEEPSSLADLHAHLFDLSKHAMSRPFTEPNKRIGFYD